MRASGDRTKSHALSSPPGSRPGVSLLLRAAIIQLINGCEGKFRKGTLLAFAGLCKGFFEGDRFGQGASVLAWKELASEWVPGVISRKLQANRCDVRLADSELIEGLRQEYVLAPNAGGPGALLREAAKIDSVEIMEVLIEKGISVFECDPEANTALHVAAMHGRHNAVCAVP